MTGEFIIAKLKNLQPIEGADKIQQAKIFGETVIIPITHKEGDMGLLFDCETQLSVEYVHYNNLFRNENMNFDKEITGYIEEKRRVKPIKLRGVKCSGLWMPLTSLNNIPDLKDFDVSELKEGYQNKSVNGVNICDKYISKQTRERKNKIGKAKINKTPTFREHVDTDQFMRNLHELNESEIVITTEKLHGTSGRVGYLPVIKKPKLWEKIFGFLVNGSFNLIKSEYGFVVGSRRVVKSTDGEEVENKNHFYNEDLWTKIGYEFFNGKLNKGETVYFEIVGFLPDGGYIMSPVNNEKLKKFMDKDEYKKFTSRYGQVTEFTYGCSRSGQPCDVYIYRITTTNEDGVSYDLSWDQVKIRSEEMGVKHVPELDRRILSIKEIQEDIFVDFIEEKSKAPSLEFPSHIREGVVVRIENGKKTPTFLKHKSFTFKVLEGIVKESDIADMEESN